MADNDRHPFQYIGSRGRYVTPAAGTNTNQIYSTAHFFTVIAYCGRVTTVKELQFDGARLSCHTLMFHPGIEQLPDTHTKR